MLLFIERDTYPWPVDSVNTHSDPLVSHFPLWAVVSSTSDVHNGISLSRVWGCVLVIIFIAVTPPPHTHLPDKSNM